MNLFQKLLGRKKGLGDQVRGDQTNFLFNRVLHDIADAAEYNGSIPEKTRAAIKDFDNKLWVGEPRNGGESVTAVAVNPQAAAREAGVHPEDFTWGEAAGPLQFDDRLNLNEQQIYNLLGENTPILENIVKHREDAVWNYYNDLNDKLQRCRRSGADCSALEDEAADAIRSLENLESSKDLMFPSDARIVRDPVLYTGGEYAPWVRDKARKLVSGED